MKSPEKLLDEIWKRKNHFTRMYRIRPDEIVLSENDCRNLVGAFGNQGSTVFIDPVGKVTVFGMKVLRSRDQDEGDISFGY